MRAGKNFLRLSLCVALSIFRAGRNAEDIILKVKARGVINNAYA
ncbi:hypothetical protein ENTCAN_05952 [Enterobacter cancerogenus ATCC 35316]|nr:hypothetical protein ENTCAN_05952 [Enterobacter cancerogenus ATCC 35316]